MAHAGIYNFTVMGGAVKPFCRALACFFLELSGQPVWNRFVNPVVVSVQPVTKLTPEREKLAQIHSVAASAIRTRSTTDDKPALAMIEAMSR